MEHHRPGGAGVGGVYSIQYDETPMSNYSNSSTKKGGKSALAAGRAYLRGGLSVIPVRPDGSKAPAISSWGEYQTRLPTEDEVRHWWGGKTLAGIAVIC